MTDVVISKENAVQKFRTNATSVFTNNTGADLIVRLSPWTNDNLHTIVDTESLSVPPGFVVEVVADPDAAIDVEVQLSAAQAAFEDVADTINTTDKYLGKMVWDTTSAGPLWAAGPDADDIWVDGAGTTVYTPV